MIKFKVGLISVMCPSRLIMQITTTSYPLSCEKYLGHEGAHCYSDLLDNAKVHINWEDVDEQE